MVECLPYGSKLIQNNNNMNQMDIKLSKMQLIHLGNKLQKRMGRL